MKGPKELPEYLRVPWGVRDAVLLVAGWFVAQVLLGVILALLARVIPPVAGFLAGVRSEDVGATFALDLIGVALGFGLMALFLRHYRVGWQMVGWRRVSVWRAVGYLVVILVVFLIAAQVTLELVKLLVPAFDPNQAQTNEFTKGADSHWSLALIALVLIPPVLEETIFRGFIFPALAKRTGLIWGAVLSSALFGLAHGQANLFVYTMILGLLLCFMYVRTRSIVPGILLHMVNNYLAFLAITSK
ncbi:MAG TPA: type II CAAX endopeptidase family protein [Candidatus Saccharimonadia bacterium]|nr:type II CAAX endopeptidase family protein [Candidatus Saccharimonadia bacterium]